MNAADKGMQRRGCEEKMDDETSVMIKSADGWFATGYDGEPRRRGMTCQLSRNVGGT